MVDLAKVIEVLDGGGLVMHATETCYGLAVDVFNQDALAKLYKVKEMSLDKPVSILVDGLEMAQKYGEFSEKALELAEKYWPGPLSILVPRKESLPDFVNPGAPFVSLRFSSDEFSTAMARGLGRPVSTTSANISGRPQLYSCKDLGGLEGKIDLIVDTGEIEARPPSTIVKVNGNHLEVLRQGSIEI